MMHEMFGTRKKDPLEVPTSTLLAEIHQNKAEYPVTCDLQRSAGRPYFSMVSILNRPEEVPHGPSHENG